MTNQSDLIINKKSKTTFVFFGGVGLRPGLPIFEFKKLMEDKNANQIYIRDLHKCFYMNGIINPSEENNLDHSINDVKNIIKEFNNTDIIGMGNSAGGYFAVLVGNLLKFKKVIAFSAMSFIDDSNRRTNKDFRFQRFLKESNVRNIKNNIYFDLNNFPINIPTEFHYSTNDKLDTLHANRIIHAKHIGYKFGKHGNLVKLLRNKGILNNIIEGELNER